MYRKGLSWEIEITDAGRMHVTYFVTSSQVSLKRVALLGRVNQNEFVQAAIGSGNKMK